MTLQYIMYSLAFIRCYSCKKSKTKSFPPVVRWVEGQYDNTVVSDTDQNIQGPTMHLCAKFGCSTPKGLGGVGGHRDKHADRLIY